ncbi:MAG: zinc-ribbon domain-containing protein [Clostridia bacterium]|nr:zinc-ribbon domain-containing protein [Clostridia bacterium]
MAKCPKCNAELADDAKFCTACGEKLEAAAQPQQPIPEAPKTEAEAPKAETAAASAAAATSSTLQDLNNTPDITDQFDAADINDNKVMSILCYLGWLILIPLLASKSRYVKFHANQGLILFIAGFLSIIPLVGWVISIVAFILAILGIINAVNGRAKQLPIIGKFSLIKY